MRSVDTNVLARLILQDDAEQADRAERVVAEPFWITTTVWLELGWVLFRRLKLDRATVGGALEAILDMETAYGSDPEGIRWAIGRFRQGADWADMIHLVAAGRVADRFATFDTAIERYVEGDVPIPIETLR